MIERIIEYLKDKGYQDGYLQRNKFLIKDANVLEMIDYLESLKPIKPLLERVRRTEYIRCAELSIEIDKVLFKD